MGLREGRTASVLRIETSSEMGAAKVRAARQSWRKRENILLVL